MAGPNLQPHVSDTDEHGNEIPNNTPPPTTTNNEENQTPAAAAVTIIFRTANGAEVSFKLKPTTKLKKAMDAYAAREGQERTVLRFLFEGERVLDDSTAASMGIEDGDTVDVHTEQTGGCGGSCEGVRVRSARWVSENAMA